ncbi:MAG: redox-sensing transcriptional repressor Rex [Planctomycetota bacterium]
MARASKKTSQGGGTEPRPRAVGRLSLYRRLLRELFAERSEHVFSHQLAEAAGASAAQVRRDLMLLGYSGRPHSGYDVRKLARSIDECLDAEGGQRAALVGVGNLGRSLIGRFVGRNSKLELVAAFDSDPAKVKHMVGGCLIHSTTDLPRVARERRIGVAVIAVPAADAQDVADACFAAGIRGILNFAPVPVKAPEGTFVLHVDLTMALETVAFFARREKQSTSTVSGT